MLNLSRSGLLLLSLSLATITLCASLRIETDGNLKTAVILSPPFFQSPGSVVNDYYYDIDFPRGHIALKSFNAEVVDEEGNPVPLHETYLHHWAIYRYYERIGSDESWKTKFDPHNPSYVPVWNSGNCPGTFGQYFGLGSETRGTPTWIPDPYGIEIGNPKDVPKGYQERWSLNVHAIDTRGVQDRLGCTECKCSLYNLTKDERGKPLTKDYIGGLYCCYDQTHCSLREGFQGGVLRKLYMRYTVMWVDWNQAIVPVRIYIFDVTDTTNRLNGSTDGHAYSGCQVEYQVLPCGLESASNGGCIDSQKTTITIARGGDIIYAAAHQHSGGIGASLYGQDGRLLCESTPTYGTGREAGNEAGFIVGMSACYPRPGSVRVANGEVLMLESNYNNSHLHTGVMGFFYFLVADPQTTTTSFLTATFNEGSSLLSNYPQAPGVIGIIVVVSACICISYLLRSRREEGYQSLMI